MVRTFAVALPVASFLAFLGAGAPRPAAANDTLGVLEKEAVEEALAARGLTREPAPEGKIVGAIHVVTLEVFSERDGFPFAQLRWANMFHRTTREHILRRESLIQPGDIYDPAVVEETSRNLRNPALSNVMVVLPVRAPQPGAVDILIVSRDVWSLRLNTDFEIQEGELIAFTASLSENNLLGWHKSVALVFGMDLGTMAFGPTYYDPNIAGTRLTLSASARALFSRQDGLAEGWSWRTSLAYPLYSLSRRWGASFAVAGSDAVVRSFLGTNLRRVDLDATPEVERFPWIYRIARFGTTASVTHSFPGAVIQRVSVSHQYAVVRPAFTGDFPDDPQAREAFARERFPRSERSSALVADYSLFTPRYIVRRNLGTFDLREDYRLGPSAGASVGRTFEPLGAERTYSWFGASGGWSTGWGGGFQRLGLSWGARLEDGRLVDKSFAGALYGASPILARTFRVVGTFTAFVLLDETQPSLVALGGEGGLRGHTLGDVLGKNYILGHLEVRSLPVPLYSMRLGGLVFWDVGDAATPRLGEGSDLSRLLRSLGALEPQHDLGFGLRLLIPQLDSFVLRVDWAFATRDTPHTQAGWPGRISIGFRQVF